MNKDTAKTKKTRQAAEKAANLQWDEDQLKAMQQEMDVVSTAKVFLDALSKTPYNNKLITDAQIIVKQLLLFFETPSKYNPDAIVEQPDVDLEMEIDRFWDSCIKHKNEIGGNVIWSNKIEIEVLASHFFELGLIARKEK